MTETLIFAAVAIVLLLLLIWLAREVRTPKPVRVVDGKLALESPALLNCQHFPQVLQALSKADHEYLLLRVSARTRRKVLAERRAVARAFLAGLREDFRRIDQFGRTIAALSPEIERRQELHRLRLAFQFEYLSLSVRIRLATGRVSVPLLTRVASIVGGQAAQLEAAMARLEELSLSAATPKLSV